MFWSPRLCPQVLMVQSLLVSRQQASVSFFSNTKGQSQLSSFMSSLAGPSSLPCAFLYYMHGPWGILIVPLTLVLLFSGGHISLFLFWMAVIPFLIYPYHQLTSSFVTRFHFQWRLELVLCKVSRDISIANPVSFPHLYSSDSLCWPGHCWAALLPDILFFHITKLGWSSSNFSCPPCLISFPFNCGYFPNRVFYLYSLSIYQLLWVRNKFQWNAHHQILVWWAVLTRSACPWFLMPISTHTASHLTVATVSPMGIWSVTSASFQTYQVQGQAHEFPLQPASLHC